MLIFNFISPIVISHTNERHHKNALSSEAVKNILFKIIETEYEGADQKWSKVRVQRLRILCFFSFEPNESKERLLFIVYVALGVFSIYWVMHVIMVGL